MVNHTAQFRHPMPGVALLASLAEERCMGDGHEQYVGHDGTERWETVAPTQLVNDVREEIADAFAYVSAIAWRTHDTQWLGLFPLLGLVWEKLDQLEQQMEAR